MSLRSINTLPYVALPLFIGSSIYFLFREGSQFYFPNSKVILSWLPSQWIIFTLPDFLWLFALLQSMRLIWQAEKRVWFWLILCTFLSIGSEIFQLHGYIPGTFDYYDLTAYLLAFLIVSIHTSIPQLKQFQHENIR